MYEQEMFEQEMYEREPYRSACFGEDAYQASREGYDRDFTEPDQNAPHPRLFGIAIPHRTSPTAHESRHARRPEQDTPAPELHTPVPSPKPEAAPKRPALQAAATAFGPGRPTTPGPNTAPEPSAATATAQPDPAPEPPAATNAPWGNAPAEPPAASSAPSHDVATQPFSTPPPPPPNLDAAFRPIATISEPFNAPPMPPGPNPAPTPPTLFAPPGQATPFGSPDSPEAYLPPSPQPTLFAPPAQSTPFSSPDAPEVHLPPPPQPMARPAQATPFGSPDSPEAYLPPPLPQFPTASLASPLPVPDVFAQPPQYPDGPFFALDQQAQQFPYTSAEPPFPGASPGASGQNRFGVHEPFGIAVAPVIRAFPATELYPAELRPMLTRHRLRRRRHRTAASMLTGAALAFGVSALRPWAALMPSSAAARDPTASSALGRTPQMPGSIAVASSSIGATSSAGRGPAP